MKRMNVSGSYSDWQINERLLDYKLGINRRVISQHNKSVYGSNLIVIDYKECDNIALTIHIIQDCISPFKLHKNIQNKIRNIIINIEFLFKLLKE